MVRRPGLLLVALLILCAAGLSASAAHAQSSTYWCSANPDLDTCVVSASIDGNPITADNPDFDVWATPAPVGSFKSVQFAVAHTPNEGDLSPEIGDTFDLKIRTNVVPREINTHGESMTYTRTSLGGGMYEVEISGNPVSVTPPDGCWNTTAGSPCTEVAPWPSSVILEGEIIDDDYSEAGLPPGFVDSLYGMDVYTNITSVNLPPWFLVIDRKWEIQVELADHHFLHDGMTLVHGTFSIRLPATFLKTYWGIDRPATLAPDGLRASVGAGPVTIAIGVEPGGTGAQVKVSGLTFSRRKLRIRLAHVTPSAPTHINVTRLSATTARVAFRGAQPRGQRVRGYTAFCFGAGRLKVVGRQSPLTIEGLTPRNDDECTLRARSLAGYGRPSYRFDIAGHPRRGRRG